MVAELSKTMDIEIGGFSFTITISQQQLFNCILDFTMGNRQVDQVGGVGATIAKTSGVVKLKYNQIFPQEGMPANMLLIQGDVEMMSIDATTDYVGSQFIYSDENGDHPVFFQDDRVQLNF